VCGLTLIIQRYNEQTKLFSTILRQVKEENVPSIKMIEKLGFKLFKVVKRVKSYKLKQ